MTTPNATDPIDPGRRRFLGWMLGAGAAAGVGCAAGTWPRARTSTASVAPAPTTTPALSTGLEVPVTFPASPSVPGDRLLVVLQMTGGNDGLNTLVPLDDGRYHDARPALALKEDMVELEGHAGLGLHPALAPLEGLWSDGSLTLVASTGMPDQTRSHFTSLDSWWRASPDSTTTSGWLGRWLQATTRDTADSLSPLRAVALGAGGGALRAPGVASTVIQDPARVGVRPMPGIDVDLLSLAVDVLARPSTVDPPALAASRSGLENSLEASTLVADLVDEASPPEGAGPATTLLDTTASLFERDIGTRVVVVGVGGFDTHADQLDRHWGLLADVGAGIDHLFTRLHDAGLADRTLLVGMSEFGRRVRENGSAGTDHGRAGLQLLAGPAVRGGVVTPWELGTLEDGDLAIQTDARSVYAAALDWLGGPTAEILGADVEDLDLLVSA